MDLMEGQDEAELDLSFLPPTLKKLKEFADLLDKKGEPFDGNFGLGWTDIRMAYHQTPLDVLPFMTTGVDGIHVGLLTDFGKITDLEQAFVVCVSPMEDPENAVKLLARKPKEFIDYLTSDTDTDLLLLYNGPMIESKDQCQRFLKEAEEDSEANSKRNEMELKLRNFMDCKEIVDVYDYVQTTVTVKRNAQMVLPTLDCLGVAIFGKTSGEQCSTSLERTENMTFTEICTYFEQASDESKLVFIRDAQFTGVIFEDSELKAFLVKELEKMGCSKEAERLKSYDW
ncbi:hypothetical protein A1A1_07514 [Planococcus antarcticus DSM 14505]|uniref:Uncharacterized protein n=1 Tax=Planococcus antarcticus DSM 14505 TaxID=1185653 RepID=A0A1C7DI20_9BACL|nr:hypothetical protein [Planococcus antarcticus]ANU11048.1 hypothetical protein BBH88_12440 [Planococcus antarcticus DSM 14505]EIM07011.1 hypothetical protein A1A1_07514 [Planococcus antarcticus DSM 14505]